MKSETTVKLAKRCFSFIMIINIKITVCVHLSENLFLVKVEMLANFTIFIHFSSTLRRRNIFGGYWEDYLTFCSTIPVLITIIWSHGCAGQARQPGVQCVMTWRVIC